MNQPSRSTVFLARSGCDDPLNTLILGILTCNGDGDCTSTVVNKSTIAAAVVSRLNLLRCFATSLFSVEQILKVS